MKSERSRASLLRRPLRCFAVLLLSCSLVMSSGCFGGFPLSRAVSRLNEDVSENEFWQTIVFWAFSATLYPVFFLIDAFILNVIEFWSGESLELAGIEHSEDGNRIVVHARAEDGRELIFQLERRGSDGFAVIGEDGEVEGVVRRAGDGGMLMTSAEGDFVGRLPAAPLPSPAI